MSGKCLETELADHPQGLPLEEALVWFHGIAAGVAYLHDHGIVHRDLKPGNIFCDEGVVKVGDYGLSKFISCSRRSGHTESIGTVHYMAPEVAHGRYGKELDIYALGAILYELLTGRVPFDGESVGEVLMKHLTAQPDVSKLAEPYRSVVARALEKDPARRFATVGEMVAALPAAGRARAACPALPDRPRQEIPRITAKMAVPRARVHRRPPMPPPRRRSAGRGRNRGRRLHRSGADRPVCLPAVAEVQAELAESELPPWARVLIAIAGIFMFLILDRYRASAGDDPADRLRGLSPGPFCLPACFRPIPMVPRAAASRDVSGFDALCQQVAPVAAAKVSRPAAPARRPCRPW